MAQPAVLDDYTTLQRIWFHIKYTTKDFVRRAFYLDVWAYYPLNQENYTPFNELFDNMMFSLDGHYGAGTTLCCDPRIRDHSLWIPRWRAQGTLDDIRRNLPADGWIEIHK